MTPHPPPHDLSALQDALDAAHPDERLRLARSVWTSVLCSDPFDACLATWVWDRSGHDADIRNSLRMFILGDTWGKTAWLAQMLAGPKAPDLGTDGWNTLACYAARAQKWDVVNVCAPHVTNEGLWDLLMLCCQKGAVAEPTARLCAQHAKLPQDRQERDMLVASIVTRITPTVATDLVAHQTPKDQSRFLWALIRMWVDVDVLEAVARVCPSSVRIDALPRSWTPHEQKHPDWALSLTALLTGCNASDIARVLNAQPWMHLHCPDLVIQSQANRAGPKQHRM